MKKLRDFLIDLVFIYMEAFLKVLGEANAANIVTWYEDYFDIPKTEPHKED